MAAKQLNIANLQELDRGKVAVALNHAMRTCVMDIEDRPADKTARIVELKIKLSPKLDKDTGALDLVGAQFQISTKLPVRQSIVYPMLAAKEGTLAFQPECPLDPRQAAFEFPEHVNKNTGEVESADPDDPNPDEVSRIE